MAKKQYIGRIVVNFKDTLSTNNTEERTAIISALRDIATTLETTHNIPNVINLSGTGVLDSVMVEAL